MPRERKIFKHIEQVLEETQQPMTISEIKKAVEAKKLNFSWEAYRNNLDWLMDRYHVGRIGKKYYLLNVENRMGYYDSGVHQIKENLHRLSDVEQAVISIYLMKGLEEPIGAFNHFLNQKGESPIIRQETG
jgi:hypothetical protein